MIPYTERPCQEQSKIQTILPANGPNPSVEQSCTILSPKFPISFMPQELCKLVCIPWTTNNAGSSTKNTLLDIGSWVGSFHCNIWFICGSHHPCDTNLMFVGRPCQIQTNPQWSSPPLATPFFFFLKYRFFHRLEGKTTFFIGFKQKPLFQHKPLFLSVFTKKRVIHRFL